MNSYSFEIIGSYYLLILLSLAIASAIYISYKRTIPPISSATRNFLMLLRFIAMFIILFLIFDPILNIKTAKNIEPKISYFIDNSQSMAYSYNKPNELKNKIESLINLNEEDELYGFDSELLKKEIDSINFNGVYTDISSIFTKITSYKSSDNQIANVLITDGNFNQGRNPLIDLKYIDKPIYVIGVGDTTKYIDVLATNILLNKISYINSLVPIEVNIETQEIDTGLVKAILFENATPIDTTEFRIFENQINYNINFEYTPKSMGDKRISVKLISNFQESNLKNNQISNYIKILDDKRSLLLLSSAPSSDISFLIDFLNKKDNYKVSKFIQKKGAIYFKEPTIKDFNESQLIILNNFPDKNTPDLIIKEVIEQIKKGKPLLFMFGPNIDTKKLMALKDYLPFEIISHSQNEFQVLANPTAESVGDAIMNFNSTNDNVWDNLPTVLKSETFVKVKPSAKLLMNLKINNNVLNESFLLSSEINEKKNVAIMAYSLYRWKLLGYAKKTADGNVPEMDFYDEFFNNIFKWLAVKETDKQFVINTNKQEYASGEEVQFNSQLYDNSYNPLDEAEIKVFLNSDKEKREIILTPLSNGQYKTNLKGLPAGTYNYKAIANYKNNKIAEETGIFNIGDIPLEFLRTNTNQTLLREIAEKSGGKYLHINSVKSINDILKSDLDFNSIPLFTKNDINFKDNLWLLIIPILLFSVEWIIRKRKGLL